MKEKTSMATQALFTFFSFFLFSDSIFPSFSISNHGSFFNCFSNQTEQSITSSDIIYKPSTRQYLSSITNLRFINPRASKPLLIIRPTNYKQVQASVICAKDNGFRIRVKSGGHDYEGLSYREVNSSQSFVIVELANLRDVDVHVDHGTTWVQSGATIGELYYKISEKTNLYGFPAGICPTVGIGGHFSGGGFGTLLRKYGLAVDNVLDALIVDSNGYLRDRYSMGEDHFWALRGGGGMSFGIVVSWKIRLVPVPSTVTAFTIRIKNEIAIDLVTKWQSIASNLNEDLFIRVIINQVNEDGERKIQTAFNSLFLGRCDQLLEEMKVSFPELGMERKDCEEMNWIQSTLYFAFHTANISKEALLDRSQSFGYFKAKSDFIKQLTPKSAFEKIWPRFLEDGAGMLIIDPFGAKMDNISETDTPFPHRKGTLYNVQYLSEWSQNDTMIYQKCMNWIKEMYDEWGPFVSANPREAYMNYRDLDLGVNEMKGDVSSYEKGRIWGHKYFKGNFEKLASVKGKVDPNDFFRHEQSIPPLPRQECGMEKYTCSIRISPHQLTCMY